MFRLFTPTKKVVERIHNEFNTAGDNLLKEAERILGGNEYLIEKSNRLSKIGFKNSIEVRKATKIKMAHETAAFNKALSSKISV